MRHAACGGLFRRQKYLNKYVQFIFTLITLIIACIATVFVYKIELCLDFIQRLFTFHRTYFIHKTYTRDLGKGQWPSQHSKQEIFLFKYMKTLYNSVQGQLLQTIGVACICQNFFNLSNNRGTKKWDTDVALCIDYSRFIRQFIKIALKN